MRVTCNFQDQNAETLAKEAHSRDMSVPALVESLVVGFLEDLSASHEEHQAAMRANHVPPEPRPANSLEGAEHMDWSEEPALPEGLNRHQAEIFSLDE